MNRKYFLIIAFVVLSIHTTMAQVSFGIRGAANMFNMTVKDNDDDKLDTKMVPAWNAGVFAEIPLGTEFFIRPELSFAQKGYKADILTETKTKLSYVELPVTFLYKGALPGGNVMIGFGPYIAMGLGGKSQKRLYHRREI